MAEPTKLKLGAWTAHPSLNLLERAGHSIKLEPRVMNVLVYLAERPGEVIPIKELIDAVWKGLVVGNGSVYLAIKQLRRALGAGDADATYIETIPKRGYRLVVPVEWLNTDRVGHEAVRPRTGRAIGVAAAEEPAGGSRRALLAAAVGLVAALGGALYLAPWRSAPSSLQAPAVRDYEITRLTFAGNATMPALSPDGGYVVYAGTETHGWPRSLSLRQISAANTVQIVAPEPETAVATPTVTPDGRFVDFIRGRTADREPSLWRVPFLGGTARRLVDGVWSPVGWSPDGKHMAFVRWDAPSNTTALVVADPDGRNERVLATRTLPQMLLNLGVVGRPPVRPAWSPDGRVIALLEIATAEKLESRVVFVDVETGAATARDAHGAWSAQGLGWLGPGSLILNQPASAGRPMQLWRMSYPTGTVVPVTNDLSNYIGVDLDAARDTLVTSRLDLATSLWVDDATGTFTEIVPPFPYGGPTVWVAWAGERVLYGSTAVDGRPTVAAIAASGGVPEEIVPDAASAAASPDGSTIVFGRNGVLWKLDAARGDAEPLVPGAVSPAILPDGHQVVFISLRTDKQSPWIVPLDGGEPVEVIDAFAGAGTLAVSPDGRRLLFASASSWVVCDLPSCTNRRDLRAPTLHAMLPTFGWTPDGDGIAYVDHTGANIWSMSLDGGPATPITGFDADRTDTVIGKFAWSRDGQRLALVRVAVSSDIVLLRGLRE